MKPPFTHRLRTRWRRLATTLYWSRRFRSIGAASVVERPSMLLGASNISIGDRCSIRYGARIEAHQRFPHRRPQLVIGNDTNVEQHAHIMCQGSVLIGERVSITGHCAIVDVTHPIARSISKIGDAILDEHAGVVIEDGVFVGFGSVILPGVTIGEGAVIGANSVVRSNVPAWSVVAGAPAREIGRRPDG